MQPFINYNFPGGWYLTSSSVITANWETGHGDRWTVPIGGGFGCVFRIDKQPVNMQLSAYSNVVKLTGAADWQLLAQVTFLFPEQAKPAVTHSR